MMSVLSVESPSEKCSEFDGVKDQQQQHTPFEKVEKRLGDPLEGLGSCPHQLSDNENDQLPNYSEEQQASGVSNDGKKSVDDEDSTSSASHLLYESTAPEYTFADPIPEDFVCPVCCDTLHQAVFTDCCGGRFCESCLVNSEISQGKSCPMCRSKSYQFHPDKFTQHKINKLKVKCISEECKWVGECERLQYHLDRECSFSKMKDTFKIIALISTEQHWGFVTGNDVECDDTDKKPTNTDQNSTSQTTTDQQQQSASTTSLSNQSSTCFNSGCGGSDDEGDDRHRKKLKSQCEADPSVSQGEDTNNDPNPENSEPSGSIGSVEDEGSSSLESISSESNPSVVTGTVSTAQEQNPPEDGSRVVIQETQTGNLCLQSESPVTTQQPQEGAKPGSAPHSEPRLPDVEETKAVEGKSSSLFPETEQSNPPQGSVLLPTGSTDLKPSDLAEQSVELPPGKKQIATEATESHPPGTPLPTHPQSYPGSTCSNRKADGENDDQHRKRLKHQCEAHQSSEDLPLANKVATSKQALPTGCNTVEAPLAPLGRAEETEPPPTESTHLCSSKDLVQHGKNPTNANQKSASQMTTDQKQQSVSTTSLSNKSSTCLNSGCGGSDDEDDDRYRKKLKSQCEADPSVSQGEEDTNNDSTPENSEPPGCMGSVEDEGSSSLESISSKSNPSVVAGTVSTAQEQNPPEDGSRVVIQETQTGNLCLQSESPVTTQQPQEGAKPGSAPHSEPRLPDVEETKAVEGKSSSLFPEAELSNPPQGSVLLPTGSTDLKPSDLAEQSVELPPGKKQIATEATESQPPATPLPTHPQSHPGSTCSNRKADGENDDQQRKRLQSQCEAHQSSEDLPLANKVATSKQALPTGCNTVEAPLAPLGRAEETKPPPTESTHLCSSEDLVQHGKNPTNANQKSASQTTTDQKQQSASTTSLSNQSSTCLNSGCGGSDDEDDDRHRKKLKSQCEADPSVSQGEENTNNDPNPENSEPPGCLGSVEDEGSSSLESISSESNPSVVAGTVSTAQEQNPPEDGSRVVIQETQTGNLCLQSESPVTTQQPQEGAKPGSAPHSEPRLPDVEETKAVEGKSSSLFPEAEQSNPPQGSVLLPTGSTDLKPSDLAEQSVELPPGKKQIATEATESQPPATPLPTHPQSHPGSTCLNRKADGENDDQHRKRLKSQCEAHQSSEDLPLGNKVATSKQALPTGCNTVEAPQASLGRAEETEPPPTESTHLCSSKDLVQHGKNPTNTNQKSASQTTTDQKQQSASTTSLSNQSSTCLNSGCGGSDDEDDDRHRKKLKSQCEADPSVSQEEEDTNNDSTPENSEPPGCMGSVEDEGSSSLESISSESNPSVVAGTVSTAQEQNPPEDGSRVVIQETQTGNLCLQSESPVTTQQPQEGAKPGSAPHSEPRLPDVEETKAVEGKSSSLFPETEQSNPPQGSVLLPTGSTDLKPSDLAEQSVELPPGKKQIATEATESQPPATPLPTHPQSHPGSTCSNRKADGENDDQHRKRLQSQCEAHQSSEDLPLANKVATSKQALPTGCNTVEAPLAPLGRAEETEPPPTESTHLCSSKDLVQHGKNPTNTNQKSASQTTTDQKQQSASTTSLSNQSSTCLNSGCGGSDDEDDDRHRKKLKSQCEADPSVSQEEEDTNNDSTPENSEPPGCMGSVEDEGSSSLESISSKSNPSVVAGTVSTAQEQNPPEDGSRVVIQETQTGESPVTTQQPQEGAKPGSAPHSEPRLPDVEATKAVEALLQKSAPLFPEAKQSDPPQGSVLHPARSTDLKPSDLAEQSVELPSGKKQIATLKTEATESQPPGTPPPTHPQSCPFPAELALHSHKVIGINVVEEDSYHSQESTHSTLPSTIKQFHDDTVGSREPPEAEASSFTSDDDNTQPTLLPPHHSDVFDANKLPSFDGNDSSHIHQFTSTQDLSSTQASQLITGATNHTSSGKSPVVPGTFPLQSSTVLAHSHGTGGSWNLNSLVLSSTGLESSANVSLATCPPIPFSGLNDTDPGPEMPQNVSLFTVNTIPQECTDFQDWNPPPYLELAVPSSCCSHQAENAAGLSENTAVQVGQKERLTHVFK